MRHVQEATTAEVIESWVRGEASSTRFGHLYKRAAENLPSPTSADLLGAVRGWPDRDYFRGFPSDVRWSLAEVEKGDVGEVLYIDWTIGTRSHTALACRITPSLGWGGIGVSIGSGPSNPWSS